MSDLESELRFRLRLMAALANQAESSGGVLTRAQLSAFPLDGSELRLIDSSRGIWNPRDRPATLSIVSSPTGPYNDHETDGGFLRYDYRAGSEDGDNRKLRAAVELGLPLLLLRKISKGFYVPVFPVYAIEDDRPRRQFVIALDESLRLMAPDGMTTVDKRRYAERMARVRLHQPEFRGRVMLAYERKCSVCTLKHADLLDAAHIVPDGQALGQPIVQNGLCLCKIHHAAYDRDIIGISPEFRVHVNADVLLERDGPMLRHGIQEMHGRALVLPSKRGDRPDPARLELRFEAFKAAG